MATPVSSKLLEAFRSVGAQVKALSSSITGKLSKSDADAAYLAKTGKAASASVADKATADGDGNVIKTHYATKNEVNNKLDASANAVSASKWATARTITLGGDASGSVTIDGSENKTLTVTISDDSHNHVISNVDGLQSALDAKATKTEVETATATAKSYTDTKVANLVNSAPETLDTLGELATALQENEEVTTALNKAIGDKANASEVVKLSGNQTIAGTKTFSSTISGSISGNAATATKATQDGSGNVISSTYLTKTDASNTYLGKTAKASSATVADSANAVAWGNVSGKPDTFTPANHNQASNTINALTGYAKASSASALTATDTLNSALGKLEKSLDGKLATTGTAAKATADASGNTITSTYATKTELANGLNGKADKENSIFFIDGTGTEAGVWLGTHTEITEYFQGLTIAYKVGVAGVSGGSTLNINNLGAVAVVRNNGSAITTHYGVGSILVLTYDVGSDTGTAYWKLADYDSDTKTRSSNKASTKMYIIGATSQSTSGQTTYSNSKCYIGTDNCLYSNGSKVATATDLDGFASDVDVVNVTGDQTVAGTKTFSSTIAGSISGNAATATKATQDASGNVITSTYATKTEVTNGLAGKSDTSHTHTNESLGSGYATNSDYASTLDKKVSLSNFKLVKGGLVVIKFSGNVLANSTLNINSTGAKNIFYKGKAIVEGVICAGEIATFMYDGTQYNLLAVDRNRFYSSLVPYGTQIVPSETNLLDLNSVEYLKVGNYFCSNTASTEYLANKPEKTAFMMQVSSPLSQTVDDEMAGAWKYRLRRFIGYQGSEYLSYCSVGSTAGEWSYGPWYKVITSKDTATTSKAGLLSATDKAKIDKLGSLANKSSVGATELASQIKLGRIA